MSRCPSRSRTPCGVLAIALAVWLAIPSAAEDLPAGLWKTIDDESGEVESVVEILEFAGKLEGRVIELFDDPSEVCDDCQGARARAPILGMQILWGMKRDGTSWSGGRILDPGSGREYACKLWLEDGQLKVRGYLGPFFRTQTWLRR